MRSLHNVDIRDRQLTFGGQLIVPALQLDPPFWRNNAYQNQILFSIYHMTNRNQKDYVDAIHSHEAVYADGYPSALYQAAQSMLELDRALPKNRLRAVFTSSESLLAYQRTAIEEAFGAPVWDRYGTAEFAVSMTECDERNLHVSCEYTRFNRPFKRIFESIDYAAIISISFLRIGSVVERRPIPFLGRSDQCELANDQQFAMYGGEVRIH